MKLLDRIAYDTGGYTVQEILSSFCKKILEIIDLVNKNEEVCDEARTIIENIRNEVVPDLVDDIIKEMEDNGYFDSLVNVTLIEQLRTELTILLNQAITDYTNRLDNIDTQLDNIDTHLDNIDTQLDNIENDLNSEIHNLNLVVNNNKSELDDKMSSIIFKDVIMTHEFDVSLTNIVKDNNHNAFTTLIKYNNEYIIAYRVGSTHVSYDGKIVIRKSNDLVNWSNEIVVFQDAGIDYRDPFFGIFNNNLVLKYVKRFNKTTNNDDNREAWITSTNNINIWSKGVLLPNPIGTYSATRGNMCVKDGYIYTINYDLWGGTYLLRSNNLTEWVHVCNLKENTNEGSIAYLNNKFVCLLRITDSDGDNFLFGESLDGVNWNFKPFPIRGACPTLQEIQLSDYSKSLVVTYRDISVLKTSFNRCYFNMIFMDENGNILTDLYNISNQLESFDMGYGGIIYDTNNIYISYYDKNGINLKKIDKIAIYNKIIKGTKFLNPTLTYKSKDRTSEKDIIRFYGGDFDVTGDGTKEKSFNIDLSEYNLKEGAINILNIYAEHENFDVRIKSCSLTSIQGKIICDNPTFTTTIKIRYTLIHRT